MIQIFKLRLHKQLIHLIRENIHFGNTVFVVKKPITLLQTVFADNAKMKKGKDTHNPDGNQL